jgi:hypothetical protein
MAGSQALAPRGGRFAATLAVTLMMCAGRAPAQTASPPLPSGGAPASAVAEFVDSVTTPEVMPTPMTAPGGYTYLPGAPCVPTPPRVEMGLCATAAESIFGTPDPDSWRPLPIWTLFTEGWNEAWVPSPNGSGGAPRQGWINASDGNFYRLWFFTFAQGFNFREPRNEPSMGNAYLGAFTLYTPLSRRLLLITNITFEERNNAASGLPAINPGRPGATPTLKSHSGFGDISFTPRVLLHETKDFSLTSEMAVLVPTGTRPLAGRTELIPNVSFWNNFAGGWVIRGGFGDLIPLNGGDNTLISQLAIGQTLTAHDVPLFGDFTYYLSTVVDTPTLHGDKTSVALTPGMRTHLGNDWYFLAGLGFPVTKDRVTDLGMILWFMKAW